MQWIYLSPHLDDAVYSCGGLIDAQIEAGDTVLIWTICAGEPPASQFSPFARALHAYWGVDGKTVVRLRKEEDRSACVFLGADWQHGDLPDCIYRGDAAGEYLYLSEEDLFGTPSLAEAPLIENLARLFEASLPPAARIVVPLTLGNHVDHQVVRQAAEAADLPLWYYADYPYARQSSALALMAKLPQGARLHRFPLEARHVTRHIEAMARYASQLTSFWTDKAALTAEMRAWADALGGAVLWEGERGKV